MENWKQLDNIRNAGKLIVKETGEEVHIGDKVSDNQGDFATILGWDYPHKPGSTGRVYTKYPEHRFEKSNFPGVFGLIIENE